VWSTSHPKMRLNQFLARAGLGSRRSVESLIRSGRVMVGSQPGLLSTTVDPASDVVTLDGRRVTLPPEYTYVLLNKPAGITVTRRDPRARSTVYEVLPSKWRKLAYVGRLDRDSEGALLFTDDGVLTHRLLRPEFEVEKEYLVESDGLLPEGTVESLLAGVTIPDGHLARARRATVKSSAEESPLLEVVLCEGKKREVRHMCRALGISVKRLIRTRFGPIRLGLLAPGKARELTPEEIARLRESAAGLKKALP
jgi:23S rRNA pseudouridine2605 synthase